jgi:metal-sulfur cluster biosynthetic enzyme
MPKIATKKPIETRVREQLHLVLDPELGISIVELGLIYGISVDMDKKCTITMTLTTMGCPLFGQIQKEIEDRVMELDEVEDVETTLTFDPPWTIEKMTPEAKIQLGLD